MRDPLQSNDPLRLLEQAKQLLKQGKFQESLAAYEGLVEGGSLVAEGHYGIGYIKLKSDDVEAAAAEFRRCLKVDPNHANAAYYLGVIAEQEGQPEVAHGYYLRALSINPQHAGALNKIGTSLSPQSDRQSMRDFKPQTEPSPVELRKSKPAADKLGFYQLLQNDPNPLAGQALKLINSLQGTFRPRFSAYFARILAALAITVISIMAVASGPPRGVSGRIGPFLFVEIILVVLIWIIPSVWAYIVLLFFYVRTIVIVWDQGRIKISKGIVARQTTNVELYRIVDFKVHQTFWNQCTGDGSLILMEERGGGRAEEILLRGMAKKNDLDKICEKLRNLVLILRTGNWGKGVIY